jgi:hypothetical protein
MLGAGRSSMARRWVKDVMARSDALTVPPGVFRRDARSVARALKRSALQSKRRKTDPFRSAMSLLNFYLNRGGRNISPTRRRELERAKDELRAAFGRPRKSAA